MWPQPSTSAHGAFQTRPHSHYDRLIATARGLPPAGCGGASRRRGVAGDYLTSLDGAYAAGIVLGTKVPVILTSRADSEPARLASCAVASMLAKAGRDKLIKAVG